jgi:polyisoprenoid-binding protein YceI
MTLSNYLGLPAALLGAALAMGQVRAAEQPAAARPAAGATPAAGTPPAATAAPRLPHFAQRPGTGSLLFHFTQAGAENQGAFGRFTTLLHYDEQDLAHSSLRVTIQMASLDSRSEDRDTALAGPDLFDTGKFPTAIYAAPSLAKRPDGTLEAVGKLTLRGVTRDLRLPLTIGRTPTGLELAGEVTIKRLDYGVGQGEWAATDTVGNEVRVTYRVPLEPGATEPAPGR